MVSALLPDTSIGIGAFLFVSIHTLIMGVNTINVGLFSGVMDSTKNFNIL